MGHNSSNTKNTIARQTFSARPSRGLGEIIICLLLMVSQVTRLLRRQKMVTCVMWPAHWMGLMTRAISRAMIVISQALCFDGSVE